MCRPRYLPWLPSDPIICEVVTRNASRYKLGLECPARHGSPWAFVTGASLLAGARNYCLRCSRFSGAVNCKYLRHRDLTSA